MRPSPPSLAFAALCATAAVAMLAVCGGSSGESSIRSTTTASWSKPTGKPIVIGTANSLTGVLAPFETAINAGMQLAADDINAAGGVNGRPIKIIHVDAKSDLNLSATAALEVIGKGAQIVVPICDADFGAPGARAANKKGVLAITCAGGPGMGAQTIGPLTFNTYSGSPTEGAILAEYAYKSKGWRTAYALCDQTVEYTKVLCAAFKARWRELGGALAGEDTFMQSDPSIAAQVTRLRNGRRPDFVVLASYPGGSPAIREIRGAYDGPLLLSAAYAGTFWLKATPHLTNAWAPALGSSYGDDPRPAMNAFFRKYATRNGGPAAVDTYPIEGYATVQTIVKAIKIAGTTDGTKLAAALDTFRNVSLLSGPTTYTRTCHIPVGRPMLMIEYTDGRPHSTGHFVRPAKVPRYPC
jgi:branched-chain amino acid transport system substrate-binding protein